MALLQASSGAAPDLWQRCPTTFLRVGVGRGRLRYRPLSSSPQGGAVTRSADCGDSRFGPSWGAAAILGTSSGAAAGTRWSPVSIWVQVDSGRCCLGALGKLLLKVESSIVQVDCCQFWVRFSRTPASGESGWYGPSPFGASPFCSILARSSSPTALTARADFWLSRSTNFRPHIHGPPTSQVVSGRGGT